MVVQLVRLKLAPHDHVSSSEFTNFDVMDLCQPCINISRVTLSIVIFM